MDATDSTFTRQTFINQFARGYPSVWLKRMCVTSTLLAVKKLKGEKVEC